MSAIVAGGVGLLIGLAAQWPIHRLPLGIAERRRQPAWTWRVTHPIGVIVASGLIGLAMGSVAPSRPSLAIGLLVLALAVPAAVIDVRWRVVPDTLVVTTAVAAITMLLLTAPEHLLRHVTIALVAGVAVGLLALASRGALGWGDAKLVVALGLVLGWMLPFALMLGTLLAGLAAPLVLAARGRRATVPLVPFLVTGALVASALGSGVSYGIA